MYDFTLAHTVISLVALIIVYRHGILPQIAEDTRRKLRAIQDDLADFVRQNGCDCLDPAYLAAREKIRGMSELVDSMGPVLLCAMILRPATAAHDVKSADVELQERVECATADAFRLFLEFAIFRGFIGTLVVFCVRARVVSMSTIRRLLSFERISGYFTANTA